MIQSAATVVGRTVRWALLLCTALGLALMHTLGHAELRSVSEAVTAHPHAEIRAGAGLPAAARPVRGAPQAAAVVMADPGAASRSAVVGAAHPGARITAARCPGGHCEEHGHVNVWSVCLAILAGLGVVALLALLVFTMLRRRGAGLTCGTRLRPAWRAPPPGRRAGLVLASTAVLRR